VESASGNRRSANKDKAEEYFKKGKVEQINHKYEKAIEFYMRSIGYNPNYFQSFCNMGYCYRALGKYV
jgi:tetratricopeptide (TPR) repeat protein